MKLTEQQQMAVNEIEHHLQIIACAGSGKTEVITRRIAKILNECGAVKPENIVAFTFTEKAAVSMKSRIDKTLIESGFKGDISNMYIGTIHGFCYQILQKYCARFKGYKILDSVKNHLFIARYANQCGLKDLELSSSYENVKLFVECIEKMVYDYDFREAWERKNQIVFEKYRKCLFEHRYLDFSQLIFETIQQIKDSSKICEYLSTVKYLVVDEYQDIDDLQETLIKTISEFGANICVVGDDDQTIYQFRGSNADNIIDFSKRYSDVTQVRLEQNFRCVPAIVDVADCVIQNNDKRIDKKMVSCVETNEKSVVEAKRFESKEGQYACIAAKIEELHNTGLPYSEMAILVRKGKYIDSIVHALDNKKIPYEANSTEYFFNGKYFKLFENTMTAIEKVDKAELYECWQYYADRATFNQAFKYIRRMAGGGMNVQGKLLSDLLREFLNIIGFLTCDNEDYQARIDDFTCFATILDDFDEIYGDYQFSARINELINFLKNQAEREYQYHNFKRGLEVEDGVHIMTVHKAKGLEFHTVFIPELEEKEFPSLNRGGRKYWHVLGGRFEENKEQFMGDIEDERKLFYVAVTRAKQNLFLFYDFSKKELSRFVREAAESAYLRINKEDLNYVMPDRRKDNRSMDFDKLDDDIDFEYDIYDNKRRETWEQVQEQKAYRDMVYTARKQLMDYYGTAMHAGMRMAGADLVRVQEMRDEDVLKEAQRMKLI